MRESKNAVKLFLDELGSHIPMASVIFCSVHSAGFDEEVMDDHDREITEVKRKVFHTNHNLASRMPTKRFGCVHFPASSTKSSAVAA